jgi:hypothetical protein
VLAIEAIQFKHDPNAATHDALNIRRSGTGFLSGGHAHRRARRA